MTRRVTIHVGILMLAICAIAATAAAGLSPAVPASSCTRVASPNGSDSAAGTATAPFKTVGKLASSLHNGEVGCLHGGTYTQDVSIATAGITLTSYAGENATIVAFSPAYDVNVIPAVAIETSCV